MGGQPKIPVFIVEPQASPLILLCGCFFKKGEFCGLFLATSIKMLRSQQAPFEPFDQLF